ncbi:unnamed protein product [Medioppia subpectinata]|uniref:Uncharacterized protein n=1 Tax=Medioppia subpectinata TaxID=1979941 RepID=A0A7R9Q692_9ACAR|nr:unnamed protein product [Medioppia subpectinata]CAG2114617.1 unnamed protein product [Medioppia subpectinata]
MSQKITRLRQLSHELTHLHESVMKDKDLHLGHPIGVYKLIQRMATEWREVDDRVKPNQDLIQIISQYIQHINTIHNYSLSDAVSGVINLVKTYKLDVGLVSTGLIEYMTTFGEQKVFTQTDTNMLTSFDCFTIGRQSYDSQQYMDSIQWLETALMRASIEDSGVSMELRADILKYMSLSYYKLKDYEEAIKYMTESMNITVDSDENHS